MQGDRSGILVLVTAVLRLHVPRSSHPQELPFEAQRRSILQQRAQQYGDGQSERTGFLRFGVITMGQGSLKRKRGVGSWQHMSTNGLQIEDKHRSWERL